MSIGLVIYFAYSYNHSKLGIEEERGGDEGESDLQTADRGDARDRSGDGIDRLAGF